MTADLKSCPDLQDNAPLTLELPTKRHVSRVTQTTSFQKDLLTHRLWTTLKWVQMEGETQALAQKVIDKMNAPDYHTQKKCLPGDAHALKELIRSVANIKAMIAPELTKLLKTAEGSKDQRVIEARKRLEAAAQARRTAGA